MNFLHFSSPFLSNLSCSLSETEFVDKSDFEIKEIQGLVVEYLRCQTAILVFIGSKTCGFVFLHP